VLSHVDARATSVHETKLNEEPLLLQQSLGGFCRSTTAADQLTGLAIINYEWQINLNDFRQTLKC
jgi:hypothetical protein